MWVIVAAVAWLAFGYLGSREMLRHEQGEGMGFYVMMMLMGPIASLAGIAMWLDNKFEDRDVDGFFRKFFHLKDDNRP